MKIAGIVLLILQVISFIPALLTGDNVFGNGVANLLGRFIFGIVGAVLLIIAHKRNKEE